jgi:uncharacterized membrane protein
MDEDFRHRGGLARSVDLALQEGGFPAGVIPAPDLLAQYNAIVPGAAERILQLAEEQATYRYQVEKARIGAEATKAYIVMGTGTAIAALCLVFGFIITLAGNPIPGSGLAIMGVALLVGALLHATRHRGSQLPQRLSQPPLVREVQAFDL